MVIRVLWGKRVRLLNCDFLFDALYDEKAEELLLRFSLPSATKLVPVRFKGADAHSVWGNISEDALDAFL